MSNWFFNEWFDGSKVVDDTGKPMRMYHGTNRIFKDFDVMLAGTKTDSGWYGRGCYFSPSPKAAEFYTYRREKANIHCVYLAIKNPLVVGDDNLTLECAMKDSGFTEDEVEEAYARSTSIYCGVTELLKNKKYDGVIEHDNEGSILEACAFYNHQIRSVWA